MGDPKNGFPDETKMIEHNQNWRRFQWFPAAEANNTRARQFSKSLNSTERPDRAAEWIGSLFGADAFQIKYK